MEDFTGYRNIFEDALEKHEKVLITYQETNLSLSHDNFFMIFNEGIVLGHYTLGNGIKVYSTNIEFIIKLLVPKCYSSKNHPLGSRRQACPFPSQRMNL